MKEAVFNTEVVNSLKKMTAWPYKIPDMPHFPGAKFRFDREKPFDIVALVLRTRPMFVAIEGKQLKSYQAFGYRHMRPCQIEALNHIFHLGGIAYVFLNIRQKKPYINRLIAFEWPNARLSSPHEPSYKKHELLEMPYITGKNGLFNLESLF